MELWRIALREACSMPALLWLALQDKKQLSVSRGGLYVASVFLLGAGCLCEHSWQQRVGGAAFGAVLFAFIVFSKEALGVADGVVIFVCGAAFGLYEVLLLCFIAAVLAGGYSTILLLSKKAGRKSRIPFLPFLLLGYATMRIIQSSL